MYSTMINKLMRICFIMLSGYSDQDLINAVECDNIDKVQILVLSGININYQNESGLTALIMACRNNYRSIVELLIKNNPKLDIQNNNGNTALMYACVNGYTSIVELLIEHKAKLDIQDIHGDTALIGACRRNYTSIVEYLIKNNVQLDIQNNEGDTALDCSRNNPHILSLLDFGKKYILSNCCCNYKICHDCKVILSNIPVLKDELYLAYYRQHIELQKGQISKKIALQILDELIEYNDKKTIKLKNELRLMDYKECLECDKLLCRECIIIFSNS